MIMKLFKKIAPLGILVLACLPLQTLAQTTVTYTADSTMSDAMVGNGGVETSNFGSQNQFNVYHQINQQIPMAFRTFIQYDLNAIPSNAIITEAKLKFMTLSVNNAITHDLYVERVGNTSWAENTITWNNQPSVISSDQISIPHAQTSSTGLHEFTVTDHVQKMVANPTANNGWRIRLRSESGSTDFGLMYYSSEASNVAKRPVLSITYMLPIEMETTVNHCTAGATDGTMSIAVSGGGTYGLANMFFYKTNRDMSHVGKATLSNAKVINNLQYNAVTGVVSADNLEPGIYILRILDSPYYGNSDLRYAYYKHILVGREGETTSGILLPNYQYQENTTIEYDKPTNTTPLDRANTNYHTQSSLIPLRVADAPNNYEKASLIKYELDFDDQLEFSAAELKITAWSKFFRHNNSSNAVNYSIVTEDWHESDVTWNTRPAIDPSIQVTVPTTTYIGYDPVHKIDTINILSFVEYWQENPNHGFEIALETYGATQFASREYKSSLTNSNYVYFEWSVKEAVQTAFNDTINKGSLTINAPSGNLPYKYLINTQPLGSLAQSWATLGDTTLIDSLDFFTPNVNSSQYTFTGLPSGKYYIGVYDNTGTKILDGSGIVNTDIVLANSTNIDFSSSNELKRTPGVQGYGTGRLYAELLDAESFGGISFTVNTVEEFYIGFNKSSQQVAAGVSDFEFGLKVASNGAHQVIANNALLTSTGSISNGAEIDILKDHEDFVILIDGTEIYRDVIAALDDSDISLDMVLVSASAEIGMENYWGNFKKPSIAIKVGYPECGNPTGSITVTKGGSATIISVSLVNNDGVSPNPIGGVSGSTYVFGSVPLGTYTLTTAYSVPPMGGEPGYSYVVEEQVAVGYVVEWEELVDSYQLPLNTIQRGPGVLPDGISTANSVNRTVEGYKNWIQFETVVYSPYALGGDPGIEVLAFRNQEGTEAMQLITGGLFIPTAKSIINDDGDDYVELEVDPNAVWRIERDEENNFDIFHNGGLSIESGLSDVDGNFDINIYQSNSTRYIKTIASFCSDYGIADQYIEPKRTIEGGYFVVPSDDILRFEFHEEYTVAGDLNYTVTNFTGEEEAGLDDLVEVFGDNRFSLDVSTLATGTYLLEIENDKGENWFIRFKIN